MGLFSRRKGSEADAPDAGESDLSSEGGLEVAGDAEPVLDGAAESGDVQVAQVDIEELDAAGPYDAEEFADDGVARIDLGAVRIPVIEEMEVQLGSEGPGEEITSVLVVKDGAGIHLSVIAAPKSGGFWPEIMEDVERQIAADQGQVERVDGPLGTELRGVVPAVDEQGNAGVQPIRIFGLEGARWCLHGSLLGEAATNPDAGAVFESFARLCVVDRGTGAMAPGSVLPLRLPPEMSAAAEAAGDAAPGAAVEGEQPDSEGPTDLLNPFERGPEITEIR